MATVTPLERTIHTAVDGMEVTVARTLCGANGVAQAYDCDVEADSQVCKDPLSAYFVAGECVRTPPDSFLGDGCDGFGYGGYTYSLAAGTRAIAARLHAWMALSTAAQADVNHFECFDPDATDHMPGECSVDFSEYLGDAYCDYTGGC